MRKALAAALVVSLAALAMVAWWTMLAGERVAIGVTEDAARHAAVSTAVALQESSDPAATVALMEALSETRVLVRDADGDVVAGTASPNAPLVTTKLAGSDLEVSAVVDADDLGVARYGHVVTTAAFLVMACAIVGLILVARDRRAAHAELARLGQRWEEVAAADDLTGLGNRTRLLEDVQTLIARGSRYGNAFGLALFEIPGEPEADQVKAVAEVIAAQARSADVCYRIAPNRFVSLLPEQDETGAALAAERVHNALAETMGLEVDRGVSSFSPWLPCGAGDLLVRAELDLGASALVQDDRAAGAVRAEEAVTPLP
jgi:GGDEF domain-containing protein